MNKYILLMSVIVFSVFIQYFVFYKKTINDIYYSCINGKKMRVVYYEESVKVIYENKKYILYQAPMASGIKYVNKYGYELFSKGNRAVFNIGEGVECFEKN